MTPSVPANLGALVQRGDITLWLSADAIAAWTPAPSELWAAVTNGGRGTRGWKKLHFGVDGSGAIVAHVLTDGRADDATTALTLIEAVEGNISHFTADGAYDTVAIYEATGARGTPSSGTRRSLATGFALGIRGPRKPKWRSRATS